MNSIPNPAFSHHFSTIQEGIIAIQAHGRQNSYGVVIRRSIKDKKDKTLVRHCYLECDLHNYPLSVSTGLRQPKSHQIGCPFRIVLRWRPGSGYEANIGSTSHSHPRLLDLTAHPVYRHHALASSSTNISSSRTAPYAISATNSSL
jgi:hypothetical protein